MTGAARGKTTSTWWQRGVMLAGTFGFVWLVRSLPHADWPTPISQVGPVLPVAAGVALVWMAFYARGVRGGLDGAVGWGRLVYNRVIGDAYNVIAPIGDVGGDPLRMMDLAAQVGTAAAVRAIVIDRVVYATSGLVFSALGSAAAGCAFTWQLRIERLLVAYAVAALVVSVALSLVATRPEIARGIGRLLRRAKVSLPELPAALPPKLFIRALGWHLLGRASIMVEIAILLHALGQPVRLTALVASSALVSVAGIIFFFVPNGVGVNEGAAVFALTLSGYSESVGVAVGVARRARQLVMTAAGVALTALWRPGRTRVASARLGPLVSSDLGPRASGL